MTLKKRRAQNESMIQRIAKGLAASIVLVLIGCAISAALINGECVPLEIDRYCVVIIHVVGGCLGCWIAVQNVEEPKWLAGLLFVLAYMIALLSVTALFFDGKYEGIGPVCAMISAGGVCGFLLDYQLRKKVRPRLRK